jgi:hypothetical protein
MPFFRVWGVSAAIVLGQFSLPAVADDTAPVDDDLEVYRDATDDSTRDSTLCIYRPDSFPAVTFITPVVPDPGCRWQGAVLDGRWQPDIGVDELAAVLLPRAGWAEATADKREDLARRWVTEIVMKGEVLSSGADMVPPNHTDPITPPALRRLPDGILEVSGWTGRITVAGPQAHPFTVRLRADGTLIRPPHDEPGVSRSSSTSSSGAVVRASARSA